MESGFLTEIVDDLADSAGFLRSVRTRVVVSRSQTLSDLALHDERLFAMLDALVLAAEGGERAFLAARAASGGLFVPTVLSLRTRNMVELREEVARAFLTERGLRDVVAALGWVPENDALEMTEELSKEVQKAGDDQQMAAKILRMEAFRTHRRDPGDALVLALRWDDPRVRKVALRLAALLGRRDLASQVAKCREDSDICCAAWAAWAGALLGDVAAVPMLMRLASSADSIRGGPVVLDLAVRFAEAEDAMGLLRTAFANGHERTAVDAAVALGRGEVVPWLFSLFERPELARLAGWAFSAITGVDLAANHLTKGPPAGFQSGASDSPFEHEVRMDPDARLPFPDLGRIGTDWARGKHTSASQERLLGGKLRDKSSLVETLKTASQRVRAIAAVDLALTTHGKVVEVRAPGFRQVRSQVFGQSSKVEPNGHVAAR